MNITEQVKAICPLFFYNFTQLDEYEKYHAFDNLTNCFLMVYSMNNVNNDYQLIKT